MNYLLNTRTNWNEPPRARHQLASSLSKKNKVIFVEINKLGYPKIKISNPQKNIILITPFWWIPGRINMRLPIINELYQRWLFKRLVRKYKKYYVVNFDLTSNIKKYFNYYMFFCVDDFISIKRSKSIFVSIYWKYKQKINIKNALFCTGVSNYLHKELLKYNVNSYLLLSGSANIDGEKEFKECNNTVNIVYVGWLSKINIDWIKCLSKNKVYKIYLVGSKPKNFPEFINENVFFTGEKKGSDLNRIMLNSNVCIAPYIKDNDTEKVYTMTNKFWLYLSYGKPIVTCEIKNLINLPPDFIYQSKNTKEFINNVKKSYKDDTYECFKRRIDYSKNNSWDIRSSDLIDLFDKHKTNL